MAKNGVRDTDKGWRNLQTLFGVLATQKPTVVVGVMGPAAVAAHADAGGATVVEIGAAHEFGAGVPRRSFIRDAIDEKQDAYRAGVVKAAREAVERARTDAGAARDPKSGVGFKRLALKVEGDIKQRIANGIDPANAPATIAAKGSSTPLIAKGQLRASVTSEVRTRAQVKP